MIRLNDLLKSLLLVLGFGFGSLAVAQSFPQRAVTVVVPFAAGGPTDAYARLLARKLSDKWGQPVVVDNRSGGTGVVATKHVMNASPDGYTLLFTSTSAHIIPPLLNKANSFDPAKDFTPLAVAVTYPSYVIASPQLKVNNIKDLIALARAKPGSLSYASVGSGSVGHLIGELFKEQAHIDALHVPYKGAAPARQAVMSGEVDFFFDSVVTAQPFVESGKMKGLAIAGPKRSQLAPNVPTLAEEGISGVESAVWLGMFGPSGMPAEVSAKIVGALNEIMATPEFVAKARSDDFTVVTEIPDEISKRMTRETAMYGKLIKKLNLKMD